MQNNSSNSKSSGAAVADLVNRLGRAGHALQFAAGLNPAQWDALRYLARANTYSRTPSALAEFLGTTKGTASQTVRALEAKGYIRRGPNARDKRVVALDLTESGRDLLAKDPIRQLEQAAASLPAEAGDAIVTGLSGLMAQLQHDCGAQPFGICARCGHFRPEGGGEGRCGLTADLLPAPETDLLCVNFEATRK